MKQTIAELGIGGNGWIIYNDLVLPKRVVYMEVVDNWNKDNKYLIMPWYVLRVYIESNGVQTTGGLIVPGSGLVYSTKEEADEELRKEVSDTITHIEQKSVDRKNIVDIHPDSTDWKQVRINAAISVLNALLETTQHSVTEEVIIKEFYAKTAVGYADKLVYELKHSESLFKEKLKEI